MVTDFARAIYAFTLRDFREDISYVGHFWLRTGAPVVTILSLWFLSVLVPDGGHLEAYGGHYFGFAIVGLIGFGLQNQVVSSAARKLRRDMLVGTLEAQAASPIAPATLVTGAMAYGVIVALAGASIIGVAGALLGARFAVAPVSLLLTVGASVAAFAGLGLLAGGAVLVLQKATPITFAIDSLTFLLTGVSYPIAVLPEPLQIAAQFLPGTPALEGLRRSLLGGGSVAGPVIHLLLFAAICLPLGWLAVSLAMRRARRVGSLASY